MWPEKLLPSGTAPEKSASINSFLARTGATNKKPLVDIIELIV